jgi:hypothetical protein
MIKYKLECLAWNERHVHFNVFDSAKINCGRLVIDAKDVFNFVKYSWNGDVFWNGKLPEDVLGGIG